MWRRTARDRVFIAFLILSTVTVLTLDFRTGRTVYKALAGSGLGYNNNYAPVTLGPDATAYVGTLGGLVALRDQP